MANGASESSFGNCVTSCLLVRRFWNDHHGCYRRIIATKTILLNPVLPQNKYDVKIKRIIYNEGKLTVLAPRAYLHGSDTGYNIARDKTFAEFHWPKNARLAAMSIEVERPFIQCNIPIKKTFWEVASRLRFHLSTESPKYLAAHQNWQILFLNLY